MTQTKWIDVNGNLYEGTIETVQKWDGSENRDFVFATVIINGIKIRAIAFLSDCHDSPEAYYQKWLDRAKSYRETAGGEMQRAIAYHTNEVNRLDAEVKMWQSKLDLLKHD